MEECEPPNFKVYFFAETFGLDNAIKQLSLNARKKYASLYNKIGPAYHPFYVYHHTAKQENNNA